MRIAAPVVFLSSIIILVFILSILIFVPTNTSYSIYNNNWNGLSMLIELGGKPLEDYNTLLNNPLDKTLLIISQKNFTLREVEDLVRFLIEGGRIILLTERNNLLLSKLGGINIINIPVLDSLFYYKSFYLPVATATLNGTNMSIVLNIPMFIEADSRWTPFIITSKYSFADINGNGTYDLFEEHNSYTIGVSRKIGLGRIYVIADLDVFINSMLRLYNNSALLKALEGENRELYIDLKHIYLSPLDNLKNSIYLVEEKIPRVVELILVLIIALGYYFIIIRKEGGIEPKRVFRKYYVVSLYAILLSIATLLYVFDYILIAYIVILSLLLVLGYIDLGVLFLTSLVLYSSANTIMFLTFSPIILFYPLLFFKHNDTRMLFLGSSAVQALRILSLLTPMAFMRPHELLPLALLALSIIGWSTKEYISTGNVNISVPRDIIEALLNEETEIPVSIRSKRRVFIRIKCLEQIEELEVSGETILGISLIFSRLGYHRVHIDAEVWGPNRLSYRYSRAVINVNVIPSIGKLLRVLEKAIGTIALGGKTSTYLEYGVLGARIGERYSEETIKRKYSIAKPAEIRVLMLYDRGFKVRTLRGEYYGVREYVPGDNPKNIHWKKSIAKGELVVKEFSGGLNSLNELGPIIIFADITVSNILEFDKVSYNIFSLILKYAALNPHGELVLLLTLPNGDMIAISGGARDVLLELYKLFRERVMHVDLDYYSMSNMLGREEIDTIMSTKNMVLDTIKYINASFYSRVLSVLGRLGLDMPTYYTIIHGKPTSFKYSMLKYLLERNGYIYVKEPRISFREIETYTNLLASVL